MSSSRKEKQQNVKKLTAEEMDLEQRLREEVQARRVAQEYRKRQVRPHHFRFSVQAHRSALQARTEGLYGSGEGVSNGGFHR